MFISHECFPSWLIYLSTIAASTMSCRHYSGELTLHKGSAFHLSDPGHSGLGPFESF